MAKRKPATKLTNRQITRDLISGAKFLEGVGTVIPIRRSLISVGYTNLEHKYGWDRYLFLMGHTWEISPQPKEPDNPFDEIEKWVKINFQLAKAALKRLYPDQKEYIFTPYQSSNAKDFGPFFAFLRCIKQLREGTDPRREEYRKEDQEAVKILENRNIISPEIEEKLWDLIERVNALNSVPDDAINIKETEEYQQNGMEFHKWLRDWKTTARIVIKRRDYLIRLGIATRRKTKK